MPLIERWRELQRTVSEEWSPRAELAVRLLANAESVPDLGCGHMLIESFLRPSQAYVPVDLIARDTRTVVMDFIMEALPNVKATHFAALGLLEYLYRLETFLHWLHHNFAGGVASFMTRGDESEDE